MIDRRQREVGVAGRRAQPRPVLQRPGDAVLLQSIEESARIHRDLAGCRAKHATRIDAAALIDIGQRREIEVEADLPHALGVGLRLEIRLMRVAGRAELLGRGGWAVVEGEAIHQTALFVGRQ